MKVRFKFMTKNSNMLCCYKNLLWSLKWNDIEEYYHIFRDGNPRVKPCHPRDPIPWLGVGNLLFEIPMDDDLFENPLLGFFGKFYVMKTASCDYYLWRKIEVLLKFYTKHLFKIIVYGIFSSRIFNIFSTPGDAISIHFTL